MPTRRKRPSLEDVASTLSDSLSKSTERATEPPQDEEGTTPQPAPQKGAQPASEPEAVEWQKFTAPLRRDQLQELRRLLALWTAEKDVSFSIAEVLRLGLDRVLAQMREDPDEAILALYRQELRETAANDNRKFGRSRGAEEYLQQSGKL
ncbi:MAG TPA: hypothetical protein VGW38_02630 [Chloroflexota bacterium]|nr:hypothetical protein [Chloroflexota bacterium]